MLSREHVIHRSAAEERHARVRHAAAEGANHPLLIGRICGKLVLLVLLGGLLGAFLFLNRGAVVEPRLQLVFSSYERPSLLVVLLLTSFFSAAGALLVRAALGEMRQLRDARARPPAPTPQRQGARRNEPALTGATSSSLMRSEALFGAAAETIGPH